MPSPARTIQIAQYEATHTTVKVVTTGTTVLLESDSGKLIAVDNSGGNVTLTLPTPRVGLKFTVMLSATASAKNLAINAAASANFYKGGVLWHDADDTDAQAHSSAPNGSSEYQCDIDDPELGTNVTLTTDGTYWYWYGSVTDPTAITWA